MAVRSIPEWQAPVLLVEDNPRDADLFRLAFEEVSGFAGIVVVSTVDQAMAYLRGSGVYADRSQYPIPRLLFLDLSLPTANDGFNLIQWIRQEPFIRRLPIIVLTANRSTVDINHAYDLGINSYLLKPFDHDGLIALLETARSFWAVAEVPAVAER